MNIILAVELGSEENDFLPYPPCQLGREMHWHLYSYNVSLKEGINVHIEVENIEATCYSIKRQCC